MISLFDLPRRPKRDELGSTQQGLIFLLAAVPDGVPDARLRGFGSPAERRRLYGSLVKRGLLEVADGLVKLTEAGKAEAARTNAWLEAVRAEVAGGKAT